MIRSEGDIFGGGRYRLLELVGQGGVGTVYRAEQLPLGRPVALKILRQEVAEKAGVRRRFTQEARAVASLDHPSIAKVHDFGAEPDGTLYLAMEYIHGRSLASLMTGGEIGPDGLLAVLDPILGALAHAHARGVIHRDLKPDNILVGFSPGTDQPPTTQEIEALPQLIKLVDFGIATLWGAARERNPSHTLEGEVVGTPLYMAPEQARGERSLTPGVDIYTLGVLLFEGLTGRHPFAGLEPDETVMDVMVRHITMPVPTMSPPPGGYLPEALKAVVRRCLQKRPEDRFRSAASLREALREAAMLVVARTSGQWPARPDPLERPQFRVTTAPEAQLAVVAPMIMPEVRFNIPLVARWGERRHLKKAADGCLVQGQGRIILLEGEAGVGKTKLATWLGEHLAESGRARWISGAFLREGGGLRGIKEVFESLFGVRHLSRARVKAHLEERFEAWGSDDPSDIQALTDFLRPGGAGWTPERRAQSALFALLVRVLERASRDQALMLLLDDVQWAASELGELLEFLAVEFRLRSAPLLVICTLRTEELADNPGLQSGLKRLSRYDGETVFRLQIERMNEVESESLVQEILPAEAGLERQLIERSGGNPLHLVQLLQYLWQREALAWDPERGVFEGDSTKQAFHEVPPSLGDLIELRLAQLEAACESQGLLSRLLERCAVLGATFDYDTLATMLTLEGDGPLIAFLERGVESLIQGSVLALWASRGQETLRFAHVLFREVVLSRLAGGVRLGGLHSLAGRAVEQQSAHKLDAVSATIAYHALQAGEQSRALEFLLKAGKAARAGHRLSDAQRHFEQAESVASGLLAPSDPLLLKIGRRRGELQYHLGRFDAAEQTFARQLRAALVEGAPPAPSEDALSVPELQALIGALEDSPRLSVLPEEALVEVVRAVYGLVSLLRHQGHQALAERFIREAASLARDGGLRTWACAGALHLGVSAWERGDYDEAEQLASAALEEAIETQDNHRRADALHLLADVARLRGDPARTAELLTRAREAYELLDDRRNAALCLRDLAQLARARQDLENAARLFAEARRRFEALGDRHAVATSFNGLGEVARFMGRLEVAESCYQRAFEAFRSLGARVDAALALTNMGMAAMARADLPQAERWLLQAEAFIADVAHPYITVGLDLNIALLRALQGRWEDAEVYLAKALEERARRDLSDPDYARPMQQLGELMVEVGREAQGQALLERAREMRASLE